MRERRLSDEHGRSVLELLIVVTLIAVITTFAIMRIDASQQSMRVTNSSRQFVNYVEKARIDSIRRHATASVQITDATTYVASIDFAGAGTPQTRTLSTQTGTSFNTGTTVLPITITFDWRGRATIRDGNNAITSSAFTIQDSSGNNSTAITVQGFGDAGTNTNVSAPTITNVNSNANVRANTNVSY